MPSDENDKVLRRYQDLTEAEWIRLEKVITQDNHYSAVRVYILPDDVDNGRVDRSSVYLQQRKKELLAILDFSAKTWNGEPNNDMPKSLPALSAAALAALGDGDDGEGTSLLKIFNSIPSPNPDIEIIGDKYDRDVMSELLTSTVNGVTTEMYPYQCRSAALMYQKEVSPMQFLDPRLIEVLDQSGSAYYYDSVEGNVLREGRYYDQIRGGILAEEMGAGKTLICLALIAASRDRTARVPDIYQGNNVTVRPRVGSLMDMAAAVATKHANPWKRDIPYLHKSKLDALNRNPGWYYLPRFESRRPVRGQSNLDFCAKKIYLSHTTLVIVPSNLLEQWLQEIRKHTEGLKVHVMASDRRDPSLHSPHSTELIGYDIILSTVEFMENLWKSFKPGQPSYNGEGILLACLGQIRFKRCIVDEGHKLGNVKLSGSKTYLLRVLDEIHADAKWIATGTPAQGLFGMEEAGENNTTLAESTAIQERDDIERIGAIATHYLKVRPWSNTVHDYGDTPASWKVYVLQGRHHRESSGRSDCLRNIFNSLMIRHRLSDVTSILPAVDTKIVELEGSYQDRLSLNLFSMMIIMNAVQSQRTDRDYFFHPSNRKSLLELVNNLRQASFYGGAFFTREEIDKAVQTAEEFNDLDISEQDRKLLHAAIAHGKLAAKNKIRDLSKMYHEPPIYIKNFPRSLSSECPWAIDLKQDSALILTNWDFMVAAQKSLRPFINSTQTEPEALNTHMGSKFSRDGKKHRERLDEILNSQKTQDSQPKPVKPLAGNTNLGKDHAPPRSSRKAKIGVNPTTPTPTGNEAIPTPPQTPEESVEVPRLLAHAQLVSTCSAKLSYLLDAIVMHQKDEQIIVFYENDNIAWYIAGVLDMLSIQHLIYAKGLTARRRSQYVTTFNNSTKFRVLLMDINQAAFGLDMRAASRVYFLSPVLNPQVEAQAIGRVRRISQQKRVTVETLVLKDSLEEVIMDRKRNMSLAEHRDCKTILDDRPIYDWILNAKVVAMPEVEVDDGPAQMVPLRVPQYIFGLEFGRERSNPDEDILLSDVSAAADGGESAAGSGRKDGAPLARKRVMFAGDDVGEASSSASAIGSASKPVKRARFAEEDE